VDHYLDDDDDDDVGFHDGDGRQLGALSVRMIAHDRDLEESDRRRDSGGRDNNPSTRGIEIDLVVDLDAATLATCRGSEEASTVVVVNRAEEEEEAADDGPVINDHATNDAIDVDGSESKDIGIMQGKDIEDASPQSRGGGGGAHEEEKDDELDRGEKDRIISQCHGDVTIADVINADVCVDGDEVISSSIPAINDEIDSEIGSKELHPSEYPPSIDLHHSACKINDGVESVDCKICNNNNNNNNNSTPKGRSSRSRSMSSRAAGDAAVEAVASPETIKLRRQETQVGKLSEEWLPNHAIEEVVSKLAPQGHNKVKILVEAFETITHPDTVDQAGK
jgi:hypothetical protein